MYEYRVGERLKPLELVVTHDMNMRFMYCVQDCSKMYHGEYACVHPALLYNMSNNTRSPSFKLPKDMAEIHTAEETVFIAPALINKKLVFTWKVLDKYLKRGKTYMVIECIIKEDKNKVMERKMTCTFVGGGA